MSWSRAALVVGVLAVSVVGVLGAECAAGRVRCGGRCLGREFVCDGEADCDDGWDEAGCQACSRRAYRCRGGACKHPGVRCNGRPDCPGGEDEQGCTAGTAATAATRFTCYANRTADASSRCDGYNTCDDGDEYHCDACQAGAFHCGPDCPLSFKCIKPSTVCDGQQEYPFTTDEAGCAPGEPRSEPHSNIGNSHVSIPN